MTSQPLATNVRPLGLFDCPAINSPTTNEAAKQPRSVGSKFQLSDPGTGAAPQYGTKPRPYVLLARSAEAGFSTTKEPAIGSERLDDFFIPGAGTSFRFEFL